MTTNKTENRGGARVANPDYKKVRRDVFSMVEQLVESNTILTQSLRHNEKLQRKCLDRIKDMRARIEHQDELIVGLNKDVCDEAKKGEIN